MTFEEAKKMVDGMTEAEKSSINTMRLTPPGEYDKKGAQVELLVLELDSETKEATDNIFWLMFPEGSEYEDSTKPEVYEVGEKVSFLYGEGEHFFQVLEVNRLTFSDLCKSLGISPDLCKSLGINLTDQ